MSNQLRLMSSAVVLVSTLACAKSYETHAITWHHGAEGFPAAVAEREKSSQPLLIFFLRTKCHACQFVDDAILSDLEIERAISDLVRVRINPDDDPETAELAARFEVSTFPTLMLASGVDGEQYRFRASQLDPVATFLEDLLVGLVMIDVSPPTTFIAPSFAPTAAALR